jgi:hypothetical protein
MDRCSEGFTDGEKTRLGREEVCSQSSLSGECPNSSLGFFILPLSDADLCRHSQTMPNSPGHIPLVPMSYLLYQSTQNPKFEPNSPY